MHLQIRKLNWGVIALLISLTVQAQDHAARQQLVEALDKEVPERMKAKHVPGMAMAVFDQGEIIYSQGFGLADVMKQRPVTEETGFNIGSISKMFTAWGVMKLVETGKIDLDSPVESYLSRWHLPDSEFDKSRVTVRALLSHTGGISVHGYPGFRPEQKLPSLEKSLDGENGEVRADEPVEVVLEPQTKFQYSGGGYTILQLMIEEVTGMAFARYMDQEVFKPLNMENTSFIISEKVLGQSATPYDEEGNEIYLERFTAQAAAGLHTNLKDLILFAKASFGENPVLKTGTIALMRTPVAITKGAYGLGYMAYRMGPVTVRGHAGSNDGWESAFLFDFDSQSGAIMLTNGSLGKDVAIATLRQWVGWKLKSGKAGN